MTRFPRLVERLRAADPLLVDGALAALFTAVALATVFTQDVRDGHVDPGVGAVVTTVVTCAPVAVRRRTPLLALVVSAAGIFVHVGADWPEGSLPATVLFLTYSVAAASPVRRAVVALVVVYVTIVGLALTDAPGLDAVGAASNVAFFSFAWAIGVTVRSRREALDARLAEAEERANVERQRTARVLAEERLRIAQDLHDVVAHSMSVIAVQAGLGTHVLDSRPEQARAALEAISATSRSTLAEMRRLLGVLRDGDGERVPVPAPGLADLPRLVDDVRAAGVPVALHVDGVDGGGHTGVELSAYRVVQEALTNVIKHAGAPTRVDVTVRHQPGVLVVEVVDDGLGAAAGGAAPAGTAGHGLLGMRERAELWGGELAAGPAPGGGFRVRALFPCGDPA